jgi:hypothetical protein
MPEWQEWLVAGVVAIGLIGVGRAFIRESAINRARPYDAGKPIGTPVSPEAQTPPGGF